MVTESVIGSEVENIRDTFSFYLHIKGKGKSGDSGNYRRNVERELEYFYRWMVGDTGGEDWDGIVDGEPTLDDLSTGVFRRYAYHLSGERSLSRSSVNTYYAYVSSWCGWCKREGVISTHYADTSMATEPLPDEEGRVSGDQQMWSPEHRELITWHVDGVVNDAIDQIDLDESEDAVQRARFNAIKAHRNRVLVYFLAYTGFRVGEFARNTSDVRREGVKWDDVSIEDGYIKIYRKNQQWQNAPLTSRVVDVLRLYCNRVEDQEDDWPIFPTFNNRSMSESVTTGLANQGHSSDEIESIRDGYFNDYFCAVDHGISFESISTKGVRHVMERLSKESDVQTSELDEGYLHPHGGRRGMGELLVREYGYTVAARYLDNSEEMVRKRYSHINPADLGDIVDDAIES